MRFEVLGPVRVIEDGRAVGLISPLRRRILAVLLARANRAVSADLLGEVLWGEAQPERPDKSLQVHVHRLRQVLDRPERLARVPGGYLLAVRPGELDAADFERLHAEARDARLGDDLDAAAALFRDALACWKGSPFADVDDGVVVGPEARQLAEARLIVHEELYEVEFTRGRVREIVPELTELVAGFPLRERFTAQLMLALYRSGRQARALTAFRATRRRLAHELGAEPGRELRELYNAMRAEDPRLFVEGSPRRLSAGAHAPVRVSWVPPSQLPPAPGAFVGREAELADLEATTMASDGPGIVGITGMAGVGKTGLALRYAHAVADRFGEGQLYLDLRGHAPVPALEPIEALGHLLRGLGGDPARAAGNVEEATAEYRSLVADRKLLVVLDNAASAEQVRPLLPAGPGCLTVITSRDRLTSLVAREGVRRIGLSVLPADDVLELLSRLIGSERVASEPDHAAALIEACAGLPLALRIAAAQLADEPHRTMAEYLAELREQGLKTLELHDDEPFAVAAAFDVSYERLDHETRRVFRLLGLIPGLDFTVDAAATIAAIDPVTARQAIRRLTGAHLLDEHASGRYRLHDLIRDYARDRAVSEETAGARQDALERLFAWYDGGKRAARGLLVANRRELPAPARPRGIAEVALADAHAATSWLNAEVGNIAAAVRAAHDVDGALRLWTWHLTIGLAVVMTNRGYVDLVLPLTETALSAARAADDPVAIAHTMTEHSTVRYLAGLPVPDEVLAEALRLTEAVGDDGAHGYCLNLAGVISLRNRDLARAEHHLGAALTVYRRTHDVGGQCLTLNNLGAVTYLLGDLQRTARTWEEILALQGDQVTNTTPIALANLIWVRIMLGRPEGVDALFERAESAVAQVGDQSKKSQLAHIRAQWHRERGEYDLAVEQAVTAKNIADEVGMPHLRTGPREELGLCRLALGDLEAARAEFEDAKEFAEAVGMHDSGSAAARGLARTELAAGDVPMAEAFAREAAELSSNADRVGEAESASVLAMVELARGHVREAIDHAEAALAIHRETGHVLGQARALGVLGAARIASRDPVIADQGVEHLREALERFEAFGSPDAVDVRRLIGRSARKRAETA